MEVSHLYNGWFFSPLLFGQFMIFFFRGVVPFSQRKKMLEKARAKNKKPKSSAGISSMPNITVGTQVSGQAHCPQAPASSRAPPPGTRPVSLVISALRSGQVTCHALCFSVISLLWLLLYLAVFKNSCIYVRPVKFPVFKNSLGTFKL